MGEEEPRKRMSCGVEYASVPQLNEQLYSATNVGYHFIVIPFIHPRYKRELLNGKAFNRQEPLSRSDLILTSQDWNRLVVGKLSSYLEVDSEIEHVRKTSEAIFLQELEFASHLSLPAILLPLHPGNNLNLAKILYSKMSGGCTYQVWVQIPIMNKKIAPGCEEHENSWEYWNRLRIHCDFDKKLGLALELTHPNEVPSEAEIQRWLGEPVKCLILHTSLFLTNNKFYPVLSRSIQDLVRRFMSIDVQYIIRGKNRHGDISQYSSYIYYLGKKLYKHNAYIEFIQG